MADEAKPKVHDDAFGEPRTETGERVIPEVPKIEEKKPDGADKGKEAVVDLENNPIVKELKASIDTLTKNLEKSEGDKGAMGKNLSAMRVKLEAMEKGTDATPNEPVFKKEEIKRVKDFPQTEQDAMSEREKQLIEGDADMKERINKLVADQAAKSTEEKTDAQKKADEEAETERINTHISGVIQPVALKLASNDAGVANKIIEKFNLFAGNDKLDDAQLVERITDAAKMVPNWTPPKEQGNGPTGGPVKGGAESDPHGVDSIIKQAQEARGGKNFDL